MTKDQEVIYSTISGLHSGFLDVKVPAKNRRKPFGPWKSWRRLWVSARLGSDGGVDLELSRSPDARVTQTVHLPVAASLCRTESRSRLFAFVAVPPEDSRNYSAKGATGETLRQNAMNESACIYLAGRSDAESQRWMDALRSMLLRATYANIDNTAFTVQFADTAFARKSGLAGVSGLLTVKRGIGVLVQDISTRVLLASWSCSMITDSHQAGDSMVIIVTTKEFPIGAGQFQLHCSKAALLARALNSIGRPSNLALHSFGSPSNLALNSLRPNNLALQRGRRLSRSEGDLFLQFLKDDQPPLPSREPQIPTKHSFSPLRLLTGRRRAETMVQSTRSFAVSGIHPTNALAMRGGKSASSLLLASLGFTLSTPGGSEAEDDDEDSEIEYSDVEDDSLNTTLVSEENERRASVASGIYEEIYENAAAASVMRLEPQPEDPYEDPALLFSPIDWSTSPQNPPPLPPRHSGHSESDTKRLSSPDFSTSADTASESHYIPMSPARLSAATETEPEPLYLPMSSPQKFTFLEETKLVERTKSCPADR